MANNVASNLISFHQFFNVSVVLRLQLRYWLVHVLSHKGAFYTQIIIEEAILIAYLKANRWK